MPKPVQHIGRSTYWAQYDQKNNCKGEWLQVLLASLCLAVFVVAKLRPGLNWRLDLSTLFTIFDTSVRLLFLGHWFYWHGPKIAFQTSSYKKSFINQL